MSIFVASLGDSKKTFNIEWQLYKKQLRKEAIKKVLYSKKYKNEAKILRAKEKRLILLL